MKNTLKLMLFSLLAVGMMACGEKKLTQEDLKAAEATLFNEDQTINEVVAPEVAEKFCKFVKQNPDDPTAPPWLYHAMELNIAVKNVDQSIELCNKLLEQYPESKWAPTSLLMIGNYIYDNQLNDTAQAHKCYQRLIDEYPDSELVDDARKSIEYLGLTPDEIMARIMMSQMEEVEGHWVE